MDWIELFFLPPYSPDMNLDEWVWKNVKHDNICRVVRQEQGQFFTIASKALRELASGIEYPSDGCRATREPLAAGGTYGSRFLLVAPFGYGGAEPDHWYAWGVDLRWIDVVGTERA